MGGKAATRRLRQGPSCLTSRPTTRSTFFKSEMWRRRATASPSVSISFNPRHHLLGQVFQNSLFKKKILKLSYIEPKDKHLLVLDSLLVGDLSTKDPEVVMPEPETDLRSPRTNFFNKIPTRVFTQSHLLDPIPDLNDLLISN